MFRHQLKRSIAGYAKKITRYTNSIAPDFDPNTIHDLRTETKKMLSVTQLAGRKKNRPIKLDLHFKKLYSISGDMRDLYNLQKRLKKEQMVNEPILGQWLQNRKTSLQEKWVKKHHKKETKKSFQHSTDILSKKSTINCITSVLKAHLNSVDKILHDKKLNDKRLHALRKKLKQMQYITLWCQNNYPKEVEVLAQYSLKELKKLTELAGDYNDLCIAIDYLNLFLKGKKNILVQEIHLLKQKWETEKIKTQTNLTSQIFKYYHSVVESIS